MKPTIDYTLQYWMNQCIMVKQEYKPVQMVSIKEIIDFETNKLTMKVNPKIFIAYIKQETNLDFEPEFKFHAKRKWRIDFYCHRHKIGIEIEGGIWTGGRHVRAAGYIADMEKYNEITIHGIKLLRFTTEQAMTKKAMETILRAT